MKKQWKKAVSIGCAACMLASTMPMGFNLVAEAQGIEIQSDEVATSGTWGTCEWNLDENGVLTISGGVAESLGGKGAPWRNICKQIQEINITGNIDFNKTDIQLKYLFGNCKNMVKINGLEKIDTSEVINMKEMFSDCSSLKELDVSKFNTSQVVNMSDMFHGCTVLTKLDLSNFDTSKVTDMEWMFYACSSLKEIDLSNFDTSKVTNMEWIFGYCDALIKLDLSNFDTSNVTNMSSMFECCRNLKELDVSGFQTGQVTNMIGMFQDCNSLKELNVRGFDTASVTRMDSMFYGCNNLEKLDVTGFDTGNVTNMSGMFEGCRNLKELDVSGFQTGQVTNMIGMFEGCRNLKELNVRGFDTANVTRMNYMFCGCNNLEKLDVTGFDTDNVTNMYYMFYGCRNLKELDVSGFQTGNVTNMYYMFSYCSNLGKLDLGNFDLSKVYYLDHILAFSNLTEIVVPTYDKDASFYSLLLDGMKFGKWKDVTDNISYETKPDKLQAGHRYVLTENAEVSGTWGTCDWEWQDGTLTVKGGVAQSIEDCPFISSEQLLRKADIHRVNIIGDITFEKEEVSLCRMFKGCEVLEEIVGLEKMDVSTVTNMDEMFSGCKSLRKIDMSGWNTSQVKSCDSIFGVCKFDFVTMPNILGNDDTKRNFVVQLIFLDNTAADQLSNGSWCDVTADIYYDNKPDMLEEGHTYVNTKVYKPQVNSENGVTIKKENGGVFDSDIELNVSDVTTNEDYANYAETAKKLGETNFLYDIALEKDGEAIQPDGKILVSIPLPDDMSEEARVYCINEDGTATDMDAVFADGYLTFATNHFSVYAVVEKNAIIGDVNGDGTFNMADAALVRRYVANLNVTIDTSAADVNKDGKIDMVDYALMRRALANWDVALK